MDKFLYTGSVETVALDEAQDVMGRLGRLGIGLKTELDVWEKETVEKHAVRGKCVEKPYKRYFSQHEAVSLRERGLLGQRELVRTTVNAWVSDHFGIAVGVSSQGTAVNPMKSPTNLPLSFPETRLFTATLRKLGKTFCQESVKIMFQDFEFYSG
jgi:hypothetical protein